VSLSQQNNIRTAADPHHPNNHQPPQQAGAMPLLPQPFAGNLSEADDAVTTIMAWLYSRIPYVKGRVPEERLPPPPPPPAPGSSSAAAAAAPPAPTDAAPAAAAEVQGAAAAAAAEQPVATAAADAAAVPAAAAAEAAAASATTATGVQAPVAAAAAGPETDLSLIAELQTLEARKKHIIARLAASAGVAGGAGGAAAGGAGGPIARRIQAGAGVRPGSEVVVEDYSANADGDPDQV
jgi:hypothetical protein